MNMQLASGWARRRLSPRTKQFRVPLGRNGHHRHEDARFVCDIMPGFGSVDGVDVCQCPLQLDTFALHIVGFQERHERFSRRFCLIITVAADVRSRFIGRRSPVESYKRNSAEPAARMEAPIAALSSARAMMRLTPWFIRSSIFAAWRAGSPLATLITHLKFIPAGSPCAFPSRIRYPPIFAPIHCLLRSRTIQL